MSQEAGLGVIRVQLTTGTIIAARYALKLRRVALAIFKAHGVPASVVVRDVSELNKQLYEELINKRGIGKLDVIRITVDAEYSAQEGRIRFSNVRVVRYVPEENCLSTSEMQKKLSELQEENRKLREMLEEIKAKLQGV